MQFEMPTFDDEDGLPADLQEVAGQLSADAQWLSSVYPARPQEITPAPSAPSVPRRSRYRWAAGVAAAVLVAGGGVFGVRWLLIGDAPHDVNVAKVIEPAPVTVLPVSEPAALPATMFGELSGAEQEAVLDLLEGQASRVSI